MLTWLKLNSALSQAVNRRPLTAEVQVCCQVSRSGICGEQMCY
jgi:hypothetical protein